MADILVVDKINSYYGKSHILFDVSLTVREGETLCLMGRNGAGKSTTFKTIVMDIVPKSGKVYFKGQDITGIKPYKTARLGLGLVPEDRRIFGPLTVNENLILGKTMGKTRKGIWNLDLVYEFFPVLKDFQSRPGGTLSGGEQQMLTIARTLMGNPILLLLDEPTEGLSPVMVKNLKDLVLKLKEVGTTILLSEQNIKFAMAVSDRVAIIDKGHIRYESDIEMFKKNDEIKKKYLAV
ncbi:MAG TPA: ABC transporter ATP-binding protein [Syntrophorhabdaceae bacterium]|jgi:branched-chain amino acid transport system ATP-binding protein|nr:ABC transporter ATP-binding protein [Syntrophorhabdaceae bacterium]MDI9561026.1 ABC transporter ATP-binding protein [Pseudomonadota bacterium]OQC52056.1 MAG: High-affinity branched-chain amino acid transport ATP-binding protein LivF [Deltaproteobacteria bacterium ADurb.Bin026]MBP8698861.1 ABC transporter ATP-binding protein [Syntrophorhabdaceae bacterium]MBV6506281.1 High-affinity branched-chain amino acid transport ATP-binding protein LivF [Syntrophorhabdaceae bacterium]